MLVVSTVLPSDIFNNWLDNTFQIMDSTGASITFDLEMISGFNREVQHGELMIDSTRQFRYRLGPKTVVSKNGIWRTYDERTNQVFIHDPDRAFEDNVLQWLDADKLRAALVESKDIFSVKLLLSNDIPLMRLNFSPDDSSLQTIVVSAEDYQQNITSLKIEPLDPARGDPFLLDVPDAFELDLREN